MLDDLLPWWATEPGELVTEVVMPGSLGITGKTTIDGKEYGRHSMIDYFGFKRLEQRKYGWLMQLPSGWRASEFAIRGELPGFAFANRRGLIGIYDERGRTRGWVTRRVSSSLKMYWLPRYYLTGECVPYAVRHGILVTDECAPALNGLNAVHHLYETRMAATTVVDLAESGTPFDQDEQRRIWVTGENVRFCGSVDDRRSWLSERNMYWWGSDRMWEDDFSTGVAK